MYCNGCGQALVAGQGFCPRCGRATGTSRPPVGGPGPGGQFAPYFVPPIGYIERRINALATGWTVYAALIAFSSLMGLAFAHAVLHGHTNWFGDGYGPGFGHHFWHGPGMPMFWFRFAWMAAMLKVGLALAAGVGLRRKTTWGRPVAILAGCVALFSFPFGTALGIWTLVVLLSAPNAAEYQAMAR